MIEAVTFDLWDTVIHDDSDEPKRAAAGLRPKREERRALARAAFAGLCDHPDEALDLAYATGEAAFRRVWHEQHVTWTVSERIAVLEEGLGCALPAGRRAELVRALEEMELEVMPDPVAGMPEAIAALAGRYRLAVVSDAIYAPGRCLRQWLERHGLLGHFSAFAFSDEIGRSKPDAAMFESVATELGVPLTAMVHVGDRDHNDVKGPQGLGMRAILFTATRDRDRERTSADAVCGRAADLPALIDALAAG